MDAAVNTAERQPLMVTQAQAEWIGRLLARKFVFGGGVFGRVTPDVIAIYGAPSPLLTSVSGGGTSIFHAQVTALNLGPLTLSVRIVQSDGSLATDTLTVQPHLFSSPADWDNITPPVVVGSIVPIYQGVNIANAQTVWYCAWPFVATGPCV